MALSQATAILDKLPKTRNVELWYSAQSWDSYEYKITAQFQNGNVESTVLSEYEMRLSTEALISAVKKLNGHVEWPGETGCGWPTC